MGLFNLFRRRPKRTSLNTNAADCNYKSKREPIHTINTKVVGCGYKCKLDDMNRQEIIDHIYIKDKLGLLEYEYEGKPAYMVVREGIRPIDVGVLNQAKANLIARKYKDNWDHYDFEVIVTGHYDFDGGKKVGLEITINVYDK